MPAGTLRTRGGLEVDFVASLDQQRWLIEAKATPQPNAADVVSVARAVRHFPPGTKTLLVHTGSVERVIDGVPALPWQKGLQELGLPGAVPGGSMHVVARGAVGGFLAEGKFSKSPGERRSREHLS